jgi:hypothetical protein
MLRQDEGRDFLVRRENIADFNVQDFEDALTRGDYVQFSQFRVDLRQLCLHLFDPHPGGFEAFFLCVSGALGAFGFTWRDRSGPEQLLLSTGVGAHKCELCLEGLGILDGGINLSLCQLAPGLQFGSNQTSDRVTFFQSVTFLGVEFNYAAAGTRRDVNFIDLDRTRDRLNRRPAST